MSKYSEKGCFILTCSLLKNLFTKNDTDFFYCAILTIRGYKNIADEFF